MRKAFIITNQYGHYLGKQREWLSGNDRRQLYRSEHRDDAVNTVFEMSSKDFDLRASIDECELDEQGQPRVTAVEGPDVASSEASEASASETNKTEEPNSKDDRNQAP